jgi:hypothetical protein
VYEQYFTIFFLVQQFLKRPSIDRSPIMRKLIRSRCFFLPPAAIVKVTRSVLPAALAFSAALLWAGPVLAQGNFETADDILVQGDFDGDSKLDYAFWRPSTGFWFVYQSSTGQLITQQWGVLDDVPVPGDYDGDGRTDFAVWRPSDGTWYVLPSSNPTVPLVVQLGLQGDIPVRGEFTTPGRTDFAVWRPSDGTWYVLPSNGAALFTVQWGLEGDVPVPGSFFTANGLTDFVVWRPSDGNWYMLSNDQTTQNTVLWGGLGDVPVPGDYDGDGIIDPAIWASEPETLYILPSTQPGTSITQQASSPSRILATTFNVGGLGAGVYIHTSGDFDGDGVPDFALWRPSDGTWYVVPSTNPAAPIIQPFGLPGDVPVPAVFATVGGPTDFAVWRPSDGNWYILPNGGQFFSVPWGLPGDIPVVGDFDGDGLADFAIWRPTDGNWWIRPNVSSTPPYSQQFGLDGDIPVPGDYDGDKKTDLAVWRPFDGIWHVLPSSTSVEFTETWGLEGDVPIVGDYDNNGIADFGIYAPSEANLYVLLNSSAPSYYVQQLGAFGNGSIYNQPPLTPFIGPDVRKTPANGRTKRMPALKQALPPRTLANVPNRTKSLTH